MSGRLHLRRAPREGEGLDVVVAVCGMRDVQLTDDQGLVRCRLCRAAVQRAERAEERAAKAAERAERERERFLESTREDVGDRDTKPPNIDVEPPPFEPTEPVPVLEVLGTTTITDYQRRIAERSLDGDDTSDRPQWRSLDAAIRQTTAIKHRRSSIRSGFRMEQESRSEGAVRSDDGRDNLIEVDRAFARAFTSDVEIRRDTHALVLTADEATQIFESIARDYETATTWADRLVAAGRYANVELVGQLVRIGKDEMRSELEAKGLIDKRAPRAVEVDMAGEFDVIGWKHIADVIDRAESAARRYADRAHDPLPVVEQLGRVVAKRSELLAWLSRQTVVRTAPAKTGT